MWVCVMARSAAAIKRQEEVKFFAEPEVDKYNTHLRISQLSTTLSIDLLKRGDVFLTTTSPFVWKRSRTPPNNKQET